MFPDWHQDPGDHSKNFTGVGLLGVSQRPGFLVFGLLFQPWTFRQLCRPVRGFGIWQG